VNPFEERKRAIAEWKSSARIDISETADVLIKANLYATMGIKSKDALHLACAVGASCDYFITTDLDIIKKGRDIDEIILINPIDFILKEAGK
jgi:predicted nucleic acid-binding protein